MNCFSDTSVLVAASERKDPHYVSALAAVRRVVSGECKGFLSTHSIAEVYASLTRLPVQPRVSPEEARRIIVDNLLPHFETVPLVRDDYVAVLESVASGLVPGARIYDALLLRAAAKCIPDRIYTFNLRDFRSLAPGEIAGTITEP